MNLVEIIYLVAIAFAFASVLVIQLRIETQSKVLLSYLSGYLFILGISNLMLLFMMTGWMMYLPHLFKLFMPLSFVAPVILFWYIKGSLGSSHIPTKWAYLHLLPFALVILNYLPFYFNPVEEKLFLIEAVLEDNKEIVDYPYGWLFSETQVFALRTIQGLVYLGFSWRLLRQFISGSELANNRSQLVIKWLFFLLRVVTAHLISLIICYVLLGLSFKGVELEQTISNFIFISTALIGLLFSSYLLINPKLALAIERQVDVLVNHSSFSYEEVVREILKNEYHKSTDLNLNELSLRLNLPKNELWTTIKLKGYPNFNSFLNIIRLQCFLNKATEEELARNSIEGIAQKCGFKSPSTFFRSFKQQYNTTPKQYIECLRKKVV